MDVFSHGLWAGIVAKGTNLSSKKPRRINPWLAAFWGVFPDVFAFAISFVWLFWKLITGTLERSTIPNPDAVEPVTRAVSPVFDLSAYLYNYSHSIVIFTVVVGALVILKRLVKKGATLKQAFPYEMLAWLLHILCDIPTHSYRFYPTPVFWPLWGWKFDGFSWGVWWFMVLNYASLFLLYLIIYFKKRKHPNV